MSNDITLPPLPVYAAAFTPRWPGDKGGFNEVQMLAFARQAVLADREQRAIKTCQHCYDEGVRHAIDEQRAEPVAWMLRTDHCNGWHYGAQPPVKGVGWIPLYGAPQPVERRTPLTDEQIDAACVDIWGSDYGVALSAAMQRAIARAIERAHGIGGKA